MCVWTESTSGTASAIALLDLRGHGVGVLQRHLAGQLQVQGDLKAPLDRDDAQVVHLPHSRRR